MRKPQVVDLSYYEAVRAEAVACSPKVRSLGRYYGSIVEAATSAWYRNLVMCTAVPCRRRPERRPCPGHIAIAFMQDLLPEAPDQVGWHCPECSDAGGIDNWRGSSWDLSGVGLPGSSDIGGWIEAYLPEWAYRDSLRFGDWHLPERRLLRSAVALDDGVGLGGPWAAMAALTEAVARETYRVEESGPDRARRSLDEAQANLRHALDHAS